MARSQSPGYPQFSLPKAIVSVKKIFDADRRSPIDRAVAQKHMGYSGPSGAADKSLATLSHYGLVERFGKGEVRVSQRAVDIIHPDKDEDRARALVEAAFSPQIFKDLRDRFGDHVSENALHSYLLRENFLDRAIAPVTNSYLDTMRFLEQEKAFESRGPSPDWSGESSSSDNETDETMETATLDHAPAAPRPAPQQQLTPGESEWMRNPLGRETSVRLLVTGTMGSREIGKLIKLLEAQKAVLDDDDDDPMDL